MSEAEDIVRAVAAVSDPLSDEYGVCPFCLGWEIHAHKPACTWRLAREWVASHA